MRSHSALMSPLLPFLRSQRHGKHSGDEVSTKTLPPPGHMKHYSNGHMPGCSDTNSRMDSSCSGFRCAMQVQMYLFGEFLGRFLHRHDFLQENLWTVVPVLISPVERMARFGLAAQLLSELDSLCDPLPP